MRPKPDKNGVVHYKLKALPIKKLVPEARLKHLEAIALYRSRRERS